MASIFTWWSGGVKQQDPLISSTPHNPSSPQDQTDVTSVAHSSFPINLETDSSFLNAAQQIELNPESKAEEPIIEVDNPYLQSRAERKEKLAEEKKNKQFADAVRSFQKKNASELEQQENFDPKSTQPEKKKHVVDGAKSSFVQIGMTLSDPAPLVEELFNKVYVKMKDSDTGLVKLFFDVVFGVPYEEGCNFASEVEQIIEEWLEEPGLFARAGEAMEKVPGDEGEKNAARHGVITAAISKKLSAIGGDISGEASKKAVESGLNTFIDKLLPEGYGESQEIGENGKVTIRKQRPDLVSALAYALTSKAEIPPNGLLGLVDDRIKTLTDKATSIENTVNETMAKLQPALDTANKFMQMLQEQMPIFTQAASSFSRLADNASSTSEIFLGPPKPTVAMPVPIIPVPSVDAGGGPSSSPVEVKLEEPVHPRPVVSGPLPEVRPVAGEGPAQSEGPSTMALGGIAEKVRTYLLEMTSGVVGAVPNTVVKQLISACIWGLNKAKERSKPESEIFNSLIEALNTILQSDSPTTANLEAAVKSIDGFIKEVNTKGIQFRINGILVPLFLFEEGHDYQSTPTYELAVSRKKIEEVNSPKKSEKKNVKMDRFKRDLAKYAGARFAYEIVAGLKPKDGFYNNLFSQGSKDLNMKKVLFKALDQAHKRGKISTIRIWLTKVMYYLIQPACSLFIEPFIDNIEKQFKPLQSNKQIAEKSTKLLVEQFTKFLGSQVNAFEEIAEGKGDKAEDIDGAMIEKLKEPSFNKGRSVAEKHSKAIATTVDDLAPGFTFADRFLKRLRKLGFDKDSALSFLNPVISLFKALPYVFSFVILYPSQQMMTWGMKWGLKQAMTRANILDGIVDTTAITLSNDLNMERARLQAMNSFYVSMLENMKQTKKDKEKAKEPLAVKKEGKIADNPIQSKKKKEKKDGHVIAGEERQISSMVSNLFLAMDYGSAKNVAELRKKVKEKSAILKDAFSFLGIKLDVSKLIDEKTHKSVVEQISTAYRDAINKNLISQQVNAIKEMMNNIFHPTGQLKPEQLRQEVNRLQLENSELLSEVISFAIGQAVEEQFDMSGEQQFNLLKTTIEKLKGKAVTFTKSHQNKIHNMLNTEDAQEQRRLVKQCHDESQAFSKEMQQIFLKHKNQPGLTKHYHTFVTLQTNYMNALAAFYKSRSANRNNVLTTLKALSGWEANVSIPANINVGIFQDNMQKVVGQIKGIVASHARGQVEKLIDLMSKSYSVGGLARMGLTMYADRQFPFQK